jgi:hypothetical protein
MADLLELQGPLLATTLLVLASISSAVEGKLHHCIAVAHIIASFCNISSHHSSFHIIQKSKRREIAPSSANVVDLRSKAKEKTLYL